MLSYTFSTMSGGKSTALLQQRFNLTSIGRRVVVMTSALDNRFGLGKVTSRMGPQCDAELFDPETVFEMTEKLRSADHLLIDEAQFLTMQQVKQIHQNLCAESGFRALVCELISWVIPSRVPRRFWPWPTRCMKSVRCVVVEPKPR